MWCTRWYLPLLLLPLPTAPAYFLLLFIFSLTVHAQPCFYCICLLSAFFVSSCYWQAVPLDTPLHNPWSSAIITFSDALDAIAPNLTATLAHTNSSPAALTVDMCDRCWFDFAHGSVFEPYNITRWELLSVERLRDELARQERQLLAVRENGTSSAPASEELPGKLRPAIPEGTPTPDEDESNAAAGSNWRGAFAWLRAPEVMPTSEPKQETRDVDVPLSEPPPQKQLPLIRREYDLRPYGFDMILDFGWSREATV